MLNLVGDLFRSIYLHIEIILDRTLYPTWGKQLNAPLQHSSSGQEVMLECNSYESSSLVPAWADSHTRLRSRLAHNNDGFDIPLTSARRHDCSNAEWSAHNFECIYCRVSLRT